MHRFRWVACQIDYLCTLPHDRARREALNNLPPDLNSTYERILSRVAKQPYITQRIVKDALLWSLSATRPLNIDQLCEALSVDESTIALDADSQPDEEEILEHCSSLLRRTVNGKCLQLAHFTVKEYLCSDTLKNHHSLAFFYVNLEGSTAYLAEICLRYLNSEDYNRPPLQNYEQWQKFNHEHPFRSHATTQWNIYASHHWENQDIRDQTQILFHPSKSFHFINWAQNFAAIAVNGLHPNPHKEFSKVSSAVTTKGISPLHFAAMLQLEWVMEWLLNEGADVNQLSQIGTPLHCVLLSRSALSGQVDGLQHGGFYNASNQGESLNTILRLLFASGADPTLPYKDHDGQHYNALLIAMKTGNACREMFTFCSKTTACLDQNSLDHLESLMLFEEYESARDIVDRLETQHLDPMIKARVDELTRDLERWDMHQDSDEEPISTAQVESMLSIPQALHLDAVERLRELFHESPESVNGTILGEGITALHLAASSGSIGAASLLISLGADIEAQDSHGQTAIHKCAYGNSVDVLKLLLSEGADSGKADKEGRTTWHIAADADNVGILQTLLSCPTAIKYVSKSDFMGLSLIFSAVQAGSEESILLLSRCTTSFAGRTKDGLGFAHFAACLSLSTIRSLVKDGMDLDVKSNDSSSVMHYFVSICPLEDRIGDADLGKVKEKIRYFLDNGLSVGALNEHGQTPLHVILSRQLWPNSLFYQSRSEPSFLSSLSTLREDEKSDINSSVALEETFESAEECFSPLVKMLATRDTVNIRDRDGVTPLELFCSHPPLENKHPDILKTMIELGADIEIKCSHGRTPLQVLFETHKDGIPDDAQLAILVDLLHLMIDRLHHSDEIFKSILGARILYWAVRNDALVLTTKMLKKGGSPAWRLPEEDYDSALDYTCRVGSSRELLQRLLEACNPWTLNKTHPRTGRNLLHVLCSSGSTATNVELMELCISMGLDIELRDKIRGDTPLLLAVRNTGHKYSKANFARALAASGAATSIYSSDGKSLAEVAVRSGELEALEVVDSISALKEPSPERESKRSYSKDGQRLSIQGYKLWHLSACSGSRGVIALRHFFDRGYVPDIDAPEAHGRTALHIAAFFGDTDALDYLLSKGANPNVPDKVGNTALHLAAMAGEVDSINILVSAGADIDAVTFEGDLALHHAASEGNDEAVDALLKLGSSYAPNKEHVTPYMSAYLESHESTASLLQDHEVRNMGM